MDENRKDCICSVEEKSSALFFLQNFPFRWKDFLFPVFKYVEAKIVELKGGCIMTSSTADKTKQRMQEIQCRIKLKRKRMEIRLVSCLSLCSLFLITGLQMILVQVKEPGISMVNSSYSTVLLRDGTSAYIVTAIAAFSLGVTITLLCIHYKEKQEKQE